MQVTPEKCDFKKKMPLMVKMWCIFQYGWIPVYLVLTFHTIWHWFGSVSDCIIKYIGSHSNWYSPILLLRATTFKEKG